MNKSRIYLAGSTADVSAAAADWRIQFDEMMPRWTECISPVRSRSYMHDVKGGVAMPFLQSKGVVALRRHDIQRSDLIVANFLSTASVVSADTAVEFGWAKPVNGRQIPIIMVAQEGSVHRQCGVLVELADYVVDDLRGAAVIAVTLLTASVEIDLDWMVNNGIYE